MKRLLCPKEAAEILGISDVRLAELRRQGQVPYVALGHRQYRYVEDQLIDWTLKGGNRAGKAAFSLESLRKSESVAR